MADDIDGVIKWAESQGFEVRRDTKGYRRFYNRNGDYVGFYPATPSNKRRRLMDIVNALKKHGLEWPPPAKGELRARRRKEAQ